MLLTDDVDVDVEVDEDEDEEVDDDSDELDVGGFRFVAFVKDFKGLAGSR